HPRAPTYCGGGAHALGALFTNSKIRIVDITDGTSQTFMVGERIYANTGGVWAGARNTTTVGPGAMSEIMGTVCYNQNAPDAGNSYEVFSSWHTGGGHQLFCDGKGHFINGNNNFALHDAQTQDHRPGNGRGH